MAITISGSGIVEANLADDAVTLAKMASGTDGEILTYDASGNPVAVSVGTDGQVLTSTGAGSPPAFEAAAAGGKVLQVVSSGVVTTKTSTSSSSYQTCSVSVAITPSLTTSKVLVLAECAAMAYNSISQNSQIGVAISDGTTLVERTARVYDYGNSGVVIDIPTFISYLASPVTTSEKTYEIKFKLVGGESCSINDTGSSSITVMEIGA